MQEGSLFSTPSPALPTMISLMFSRAVSLQSTEDFALGLLSHPSTPAPRHLVCQEDLHPCPGCIGLQQGLSMWFLFHSDCHRWANALSNSLRCFSTVLDSCSDARISPLLQSPTPPVQVQSCSLPLPPLLPSSYWVLWGPIYSFGAFQVAQLVKNPTAKQETLVWFLGQKDPLEKGVATHSSTLGLPWWLRW